jgi:predicted dehydrogenase
MPKQKDARMIGAGVIGYGYWGPNLVRCLSELGAAQVKAISDQRSDALARAGTRHPGVRLCENYLDVLKDPSIDALAIATPVGTHVELAMAALRAGKHVWLEKPMCRTSAEACRLIDEADRTGLTLLVDHTFIYTPAVRKIAELVAAGALGQLYYYDSTRVNLGLFRHDTNVIWDLAVHDFSILDHLLPERPIAISANGASHLHGTPESMAFITIFYGSGTIAHLNVNWLAPVKVRQTLIGGSRKMIVYDDLEPSEKIKVYDKGVVLSPAREQLYQMMVEYRAGDMWAPHLSVKEALQIEAQHFLDCIVNNAKPITGGGMGLRVIELMEAAVQSMRQRGHPAELEALREAS